jgi:thiamine transport system substrate-binding protein
MRLHPTRTSLAAALVASMALAACGGGDDDPVTLRLLTYSSFPESGTSLNEALDEFTEETGIGVRIVVGGDAGTMVTRAALTAGNPEADVMWGIDNTLLSRALDADVFVPWDGPVGALAPDLVAIAPGREVTPVDFGDVCLNYDIAWFADNGIEPPTTLQDLTDPAYRDLLVVEHPASSSPGLAFMLATVAAFGEDGWLDFWAALRDNGVEVVDSWESAYYERFSGSSGDGPRPLVVSYASSPPAEVLFAEEPVDEAPTAVIPDTCFRQVEFAGILRGTEHEDEAGRLLEFLTGPRFQTEIALNLFVYPARTDVELPAVFVEYSVVPDAPFSLDPASITTNREGWVDDWTETVLR